VFVAGVVRLIGRQQPRRFDFARTVGAEGSRRSRLGEISPFQVHVPAKPAIDVLRRDIGREGCSRAVARVRQRSI
jgi:hypothetical protein